MGEYTPTTEQVCETYAALCKTEAAADEFRRWLAAHDREVKAEAWDEAYDAMDDVLGNRLPHMTNPYREGDAS